MPPLIEIEPGAETAWLEPDYDAIISIVPLWVRHCAYHWHDGLGGNSHRLPVPAPHTYILVRGDCWLTNLRPGDDASGTGLLVPRVDKLQPFTLAATVICAKRRMFGMSVAPRRLNARLDGCGTLLQARRYGRKSAQISALPS